MRFVRPAKTATAARFLLCLALLQLSVFLAAQNLGATPQLNKAVQGQTASQPEGCQVGLIVDLLGRESPRKCSRNDCPSREPAFTRVPRGREDKTIGNRVARPWRFRAVNEVLPPDQTLSADWGMSSPAKPVASDESLVAKKQRLTLVTRHCLHLSQGLKVETGSADTS